MDLIRQYVIDSLFDNKKFDESSELSCENEHNKEDKFGAYGEEEPADDENQEDFSIYNLPLFNLIQGMDKAIGC